jgi:hypothetical protein
MKNINTNEIKPFNTLEPAALFLGINYFTLAKAVREGEIQKYRCGDWMIKHQLDDNWPNITLDSAEIGNIHKVNISIKNLDTDIITEFESLAACYGFLGISEGRMRSYIDGGNYLEFRLGEYIVKPNTDSQWPQLDLTSPDYPENKRVAIQTRNIHTGEIRSFRSISETSDFLGLKRATLGNAVHNRLNYRYLYGDHIVRISDKEWPTLKLGAPTIRSATLPKEIKVYDLEKKQIILLPTIAAACKLIGTDKNKIIRGLKNGPIIKIDNYELSYI